MSSMGPPNKGRMTRCIHRNEGVCRDCEAGLRHAAAEANRDTFAAIAERAAAEERARIVAWLRGPTPSIGEGPTLGWAKAALADAIERGEDVVANAPAICFEET